MSELRAIRPVDLLIDAENPRLTQPNVGQKEAMRALAGLQGKKLATLARDILEHGLNPADLPIVMPYGDDLGRYVVLEGNRRLVGLKAMENPEGFVGAVDASVLKELRRLTKEYQEEPIEQVECLVVKDREAARHWIELRHTGQNDGAGILPWASDDANRFRARGGNLEIQSQALNFLENRGDLTTEKRRDVPATSFKRLLESPDVRQKCGIELKDGKMLLLADEKKVAKALLYIANDLASGKTGTRKIYTKELRKKYADDLPADVVVTPTRGSGEGVEVGTKPTAPKPKKAKKHRRLKPRDVLIPTDCVLTVTDARIRDIENELRLLSIEMYPNAVAVLLRVFLELSVDAYMHKKPLAGVVERSTLGEKLKAVADDLVARAKLSDQQAKTIRSAAAKDSFLTPSLTLINQYVHNFNQFPSPSDIRAHWNSLQPFMVAIWTP
jgi:hypothetical protein